MTIITNKERNKKKKKKFSVDLISRENEPSHTGYHQSSKEKKNTSPIIIKFIQMRQADFMTLENVRNTKLTTQKSRRKE